jgi:hypothetical protein
MTKRTNRKPHGGRGDDCDDQGRPRKGHLLAYFREHQRRGGWPAPA